MTPDVFHAISDPTRRAILDQLRDGERPASAFVTPRPMSQPALSQHLRALRDAGLVRSRKQGRQRIYALEAARLREVARWIAHYEAFWDDKLDALGAYLDATSQENRP